MLGSDFQFRDKIPVAVLGATGSVGQRFVALLDQHPWFEIAALAASDNSAGKRYDEAMNWLMPTPLPEKIAGLRLARCLAEEIPCPLVFSALDSSVAGEIETRFADKGYTVISNARNHRMQSNVPLLVPEVNGDHLSLLNTQKSSGKIVTNPNCSSIGLTLALKPLYDLFGLKAVHLVTLQAISGAGYPGVASMDIVDNIIPHINGEEQKLEQEPLKILGLYQQEAICPASFQISAHCNRVAVTDGHTQCVSVSLDKKAEPHDLIEAWRSFIREPQQLLLPLAPKQPLRYFFQEQFPQPKLHRNVDKGMAVSIGRLRRCPIFDYKFTILSHNTIRGAAGGALLCAELMVRKGYIHW